MEDTGKMFDEIEELVQTMVLTPEDDRVLVYRKIDQVFLTVEVLLRDCPNTQAVEKLNELKFHVGMIARLDDPDGHSDDQHAMWARAAMGELRGYMNFVCNAERRPDSESV